MPFAENPTKDKSRFTLDPKIKLLNHYDRVKGIIDNDFKPPVMTDVDLVEGYCNLDCAWCCQAKSRASKPRKYLSTKTMKGIGLLSKKWGIKAWRIAGDSEPTLHKEAHILFQSGHDNGIDMGLTTNGVLLDKVKNLVI